MIFWNYTGKEQGIRQSIGKDLEEGKITLPLNIRHQNKAHRRER